MPECLTRDVVEQIQVAGDLEARKREAAEREAAGKCRGAAARQQCGTDDQQRRTEVEDEAPLGRLHQQGNTEAPDHRRHAGDNVEQRHRSGGPQQPQRLQRNHGEQD